MHEWIFIIWRSCILSVRLWEAAVSQRAAFSTRGPFTQEQHGVFCRGLERVRPRWTSPQSGPMRSWSHPIDLHYATKDLQGWPKLHLQVWHQDPFGPSEVYGYGYCHVPSTTGHHRISRATWRPLGSWLEQLRQMLIGGGLQLRSPDLAYDGTDRYRLSTEAMGTVDLEINISMRHFDKYGIKSWRINRITEVTMTYSSTLGWVASTGRADKTQKLSLVMSARDTWQSTKVPWPQTWTLLPHSWWSR